MLFKIQEISLSKTKILLTLLQAALNGDGPKFCLGVIRVNKVYIYHRLLIEGSDLLFEAN